MHIRDILPEDNGPLALIVRNALAEFGANKPGTVFFDPTTDHLYELFQTAGSKYFVAVGEADGAMGHAAEFGNEPPKEPLLFLKAPSSLLAPGGKIVLPPQSRRVDYEAELAIIIGKRCRRVMPAGASFGDIGAFV